MKMHVNMVQIEDKPEVNIIDNNDKTEKIKKTFKLLMKNLGEIYQNTYNKVYIVIATFQEQSLVVMESHPREPETEVGRD